MARGGSSESTSDLYIRLGLSTDELESGFVIAERSLRDNMARLNRENTIVDLRAQVEIAGLDESADATRILEVRQQALQHRIEIQRDRVRLASAALHDMTQRLGENNDQTQRAAIAHERERMSLARLERQLRELNQTQSETSGSESGIGGLSDLVDGLLEKIPPQARMAAAGIAAFGSAAVGAGKASEELVEEWRELQKQAYELNMSVNDAENFLRHMQLAGGDIGDFEGYIRGITDAYAKGEFDDPEFIALRRYGAEITDASGRLKDFKALTEEVYQAWKKAEAEGNGIEFLQMTGGESGIRDAIQYFKRYEEAKEDAEKIFDAGLDPEEMQEADRALNLLTEQMDEFKEAAVSLVTPATTAAVKNLFEIFRAGTKILVESKEELRDLGGTLADVIFNPTGLNPLANLFKDEKTDGLDAHTKKVLAAGQELEKAHEDLKKKLESDPLSQYSDQRARDLDDEIAELRIAIDYESEYQRAVATAQLERERALRHMNISSKERAAIETKYLAEIEQAEKDHEDKMEALWQETNKLQFDSSHSAFESQIRDIEEWKNKALEDLGEYENAIGDKNRWVEESAAITANALAKEREAFESEVDRMRGKIESAQDRLARLTLSQRDNDIYQAQKQYYQDLQELPKEFADAIYNAQIAAIRKRTREDKSGSYRKRPDGAPNDDTYYQLLDFINANKHINNAAENLVKLDAEEVARAEVLKKSALGIAEVERSANKSGRATTELANANLSLANTNLKTGTASEQAAQQLKDTADTASNLGGTLQNANSAIDKNISALKNATSATGTFIKGLANVADIEAQKQQEKFSLPNLQPAQKPQGEQIEIIYGDIDSSEETTDEIPVLYGKFADLGNATENLSADMQSYSEKLNTSAEKTAESLAQVKTSNIQQAATKAADSAERLGDKFPPLATALDSVTNSLQQAAGKISEIDFQAPQAAQQSIQANDDDTVDSVLSGLQSFGKGLSMVSLLTTMGSAGTTSPYTLPLALAGSGVELLADIAQQIYDANKEPQNITVAPQSKADLPAPVQQDLPNFEDFNLGLDKSVTSLDTFSKTLLDSISKFESADVSKENIIDITPITKDLSALTQSVGAIAADLKAIQQQKAAPPVINVNPTIHIDLAGGYVFDNAMKAELTDDITENVVNGITDAVTKAQMQSNFGFNN